MRRLSLLLALVGIALLTAGPALATDHVFHPPDTIVAAPDGRFSCTLRLTLGTGGGSFGHGYLEGLENCDSGLWADGFCILDREEGETIEVALWGELVDPAAPGRVYMEAGICSEQTTNLWSVEVDVEPFTVPTQTESFGLVKARYSH